MAVRGRRILKSHFSFLHSAVDQRGFTQHHFSARKSGLGSPSTTFGAAKSGAGFTLIELVVAVGIFVLLVGGTTGAFVRLTQAQRVDRAQITLLTDVQNFLETLEREIRTGFGSTFSGGGTSLSLTNQNRDVVKYTRPSTTIERNGVAITAERTEIRDLDFAVRPATVDESAIPHLLTAQGLVTVRLRACPNTGLTPAPDTRCLVLQTTLTSRQHAPPP